MKRLGQGVPFPLRPGGAPWDQEAGFDPLLQGRFWREEHHLGVVSLAHLPSSFASSCAIWFFWKLMLYCFAAMLAFFIVIIRLWNFGKVCLQRWWAWSGSCSCATRRKCLMGAFCPKGSRNGQRRTCREWWPTWRDSGSTRLSCSRSSGGVTGTRVMTGPPMPPRPSTLFSSGTQLYFCVAIVFRILFNIILSKRTGMFQALWCYQKSVDEEILEMAPQGCENSTDSSTGTAAWGQRSYEAEKKMLFENQRWYLPLQAEVQGSCNSFWKYSVFLKKMFHDVLLVIFNIMFRWPTSDWNLGFSEWHEQGETCRTGALGAGLLASLLLPFGGHGRAGGREEECQAEKRHGHQDHL